MITSALQGLYLIAALAMLWVVSGLWRGRRWAIGLALVGSVVGIYQTTLEWNLSPSEDSAEFIDFVDRVHRLVGLPFPAVLLLVLVALGLQVAAPRTS